MSEGALPAKAFDVLDLAASRSARKGDLEVTPRAVAEVVAEAVRMPVERIDGGDEERLLNLESLLAERAQRARTRDLTAALHRRHRFAPPACAQPQRPPQRQLLG